MFLFWLQILQVPRFFNSEVVPSTCLLVDEVTWETTSVPTCDCGRDDHDDRYTCYYETQPLAGVATSPIWKTYVVLCELMMRILPCVLLVVLTFLMIR